MTEIAKPDRRTLEDALRDRGIEPEGVYKCPSCQRDYPAFALVDVSDISRISDDVACADCMITAQREADAEAAAAEPMAQGWASDIGEGLRAERNRLLDSRAWTIRADSPLTPECRAKWAQWFLSLHQMTTGQIEPENWRFPKEPELEYMTPDEAAARLLALISV
jgi:hypothetical protein